MRAKKFIFKVCIAAPLLAFACCGDKTPEPKEYDRAALTANMGGRIIQPAYNGLAEKATALSAVQLQFRHSVTVGMLDSLQAAFQEAWLSWKRCSPFEFGPASEVTLRSILNTFPCDTAQIRTNFMSGTWDLNLAVNTDARGFPALDFLLHGLGPDDAGIVGRYQSPADSARLQAYLAAVVADIRSHAVNVADQWNGGYLGTFKGNLGTDVGSSTSLIVNELNRDLEIIKTASIGIPLGKQTFDAPLPGKSEGYFSGLSKTLMKAELAALSAIYEGQAPGAAEGYGLHEALAAVEADYHGGDLGDAIRQQFSAAQTALDAVPEPFSAAVVSSRPSVEAAYLEIQKLVVLLKTDMASALSILITYTDADGD